MINNNRIVPVQATDLISLYAVILKQDTTNNSTLAKVDAKNANGDFAITAASTPLLCSEPAKSIDLAAAVTAATVYFVPTYDFVGFSLAGVAEEPAAGSVSIDADGATLYKAVLSSGDITVTKVGL